MKLKGSTCTVYLFLNVFTRNIRMIQWTELFVFVSKSFALKKWCLKIFTSIGIRKWIQKYSLTSSWMYCTAITFIWMLYRIGRFRWRISRSNDFVLLSIFSYFMYLMIYSMFIQIENVTQIYVFVGKYVVWFWIFLVFIVMKKMEKYKWNLHINWCKIYNELAISMHLEYLLHGIPTSNSELYAANCSPIHVFFQFLNF